jgi:hypothetical protein
MINLGTVTPVFDTDWDTVVVYPVVYVMIPLSDIAE